MTSLLPVPPSPVCSGWAWGIGCWFILLSALGSVVPERTPWISSRIQGSPEPPPPARIERVYPALKFSDATDLTFVPGFQYGLVSLLNGKLLAFTNAANAGETSVVGDLRGRHPGFNQFLSFTLHPGFATNRQLWAVFTENHQMTNRWVLARYQLTTGNLPQLDLDSETLVLTSRCGGHDGACVRFGPDGMIYASLGDGSSPEPPDALRTGQDLSDLLSSVIRIDVDHPAPDQPYRIPTDNPFVSRPGARPEIWAYGFRNPWRMNFGPDGALWVGDVGWELWELIHRVTPGYNGGWSHVEGPQAIHDLPHPPTPVNPAIAVHPHHEAASITGGLFYQGSRFPWLRGAYVYGDYATGKIWALRHDGERRTSLQELADTSLQIIAFAEDSSGEILLLDYRGDAGIYRLIPNPVSDQAGTFPRRLSETGLFRSVATQTPADGVQPYQINAERWHDHATSERWLGIPGTNRWHNGQFPPDSVVAKTLSLELEHGNPQSRRRIETQILHSGPEGWQALTYRWKEDQTDADLVPAAGDTITMRVTDSREPGGFRIQNWRFGSRSECLRCHNPWSGTLLGLNREQLHREPPSDSSWLQLLAAGVASVEPAPPPIDPWVSPYNTQAPREPRARLWLHLNCAPCHRWGAGGSVASFFNLDGKLADLRLVDQIPTRGHFGLTDARVLVPGHPERSVLWYRLNTEGLGHMPHIGSRLVDPDGSRLIGEWIAELTPAAPDQELPTGSPSSALADLKRVQQGTLTSDALVGALRSSTNAFVRDLVARFLPAAERRRELGTDFSPQQVLARSGDVERGRQLFHSDSGPQCARCHVCDGRGRNFGPDLTQIGRRLDRPALLENITKPSQVIAPEYVLHVVETADGRSLAGFVVSQGPSGMQLRLESGDTVRLSPPEITTDSRSPLSAMPEGLLAGLTETEAADLLAYLSLPR